VMLRPADWVLTGCEFRCSCDALLIGFVTKFFTFFVSTLGNEID
jgi:hypothetical protein